MDDHGRILPVEPAKDRIGLERLHDVASSDLLRLTADLVSSLAKVEHTWRRDRASFITRSAGCSSIVDPPSHVGSGRANPSFVFRIRKPMPTRS